MNAAPCTDAERLANSEMVLQLMRANYDEVAASNKRGSDRAVFVLGASATAFGLVVGLPGAAQPLLLAAAVVALLGCFACCGLVLRPVSGLQVLSTNHETLWHGWINVDRETSLDNVTAHLIDMLLHERCTAARIARWYRWTICCGFGAVAIAGLSKAAALVTL